jgi:methylmalonyl-CoA/ethylmalonyl-CoA epimerase
LIAPRFIPNLERALLRTIPPFPVILEHIGIAVSDIEISLKHFRTLFGAEPYKTEEVASEGVRTYFFDAGGTKIELLESLHPSSPIARFLEKRGPGLHHLAFSSDNLEADCQRLTDAGYRILNDGPKRGADGKDIFFVHPSDTAGVLTEFCMAIR